MIPSTFGIQLLTLLTSSSTTIVDLSAPHIGLFTTNPTAPGNSGTEVSGNNYGREAINGLFATPTVSSLIITCSNTSDIEFNPATPSGWGAITGWGIWTASSSGTMLWNSVGGTFSGVSVSPNDTVRIVAGGMTLEIG